MGFAQEIKEETLVKCGRSCCLCHRFCGTKIEVHHIKEKANGGEDTIENAIPLCFDCHADMRSYDYQHPKGNKYSEAELIKQRDNWYRKVESDGLPGNDQCQKTHIKDLRPERLKARNILLCFVDYCLGYKTIQSVKQENKTLDLVTEIHNVKSKLELLGPLSMPEMEQIQLEIVNNAWNFQRLLDRQGSPTSTPLDKKYATLEENIDGIEDWFATMKERIKEELDRYLITY